MSNSHSYAPHIHTGIRVPAIMLQVGISLLPGLICSIWFFGPGLLIHCLLAFGFALALEAVVLKLRRRPLQGVVTDGSIMITALLFALSITPLAPWWVSLTGIAFAVIFAKHMFGGLGHNIFNPAMAGYVFVLMCFPVVMTTWPAIEQAPALGDYLRHIFVPGSVSPDGYTGATPLGYVQTQLEGMLMLSEIRDAPLFGQFGGRGWEWINLGFLLGGMGLVLTGVIDWRIPATMLGSLFLMSSLYHLYDPAINVSPLFHLTTGATMLGAFFIATDPVSSATTPRGRLIYAALIGILVFLIRTHGAYPDGMAFAVLTANAFVPLIDSHCRPRVLGESAHE